MTAAKHTSLQQSSDHREPFFAKMARKVTDWSGSTSAFFLAVLIIVIWAATRPLFDSFDTWQLVINTLTTIITFLMVFLIQRAQNKDSRALHLKLNELVAAVEGASTRLINVEDMTEEELHALHAHYCRLVELAKKDFRLTDSHSIEEAGQRHERKGHKKPSQPGEHKA